MIASTDCKVISEAWGVRVLELKGSVNKSGTVMYQPTTVSAEDGRVALAVFGDCTTRAGGMGANVSKLVLGTQAGGMCVASHSSFCVRSFVADFATGYARRAR
jgi:hypothetical protein